jgi:hypothetical protein
MLRHTIGSKIPVELYHFPDEFTSGALRQEIERAYDISFKTINVPRSSGDKAWSEIRLPTGFTALTVRH